MSECNQNTGCPHSVCASTTAPGAAGVVWRDDSALPGVCGRGESGGRPIVGIMCEYTPRELIMAAGGVPVCLCGGSAKMVEPAERDLPASLCPLIKSTYGYHLQRSNPFLEMADLVVAETTCDGKKKMFELLAETRPLHVLELPQKQDDDDGARALVPGDVKLKALLENVSIPRSPRANCARRFGQ